MKPLRRLTIALTAGVAAMALAPVAEAAPNPVLASPYLYQWGNKPDPVNVMNATGVKTFTLAFVLSDGGCNPAWDGSRSLTGSDATLIRTIRAAGGDVIPSFGGWSGRKLGQYCSSASALAGAYQKVINAYQLKAIDIDIEAAEFENATTQDRVLGALKIVKQNNPGVRTVITMPTDRSGPNSWGKRLITRAKELGAPIDVWSVMPFNFGGPSDLVAATKSSVDGLKNHVKATFGLTDDAAYRRSGLSSMNGVTDTGETVTTAQFRSMRDWAASKHLARFTFWATNRDRGNCGGSTSDCSGTNQGTWDFTRVVAGYTG
ncbi:chitinase [Saccharothrix variisporea]|uniref:Glycosyl hydrolase family 18 (Putative chitinase) n=1 Tax=Saccharothrix variisporea TaxID=543527 RepID=A0A495XG56_9PSEU|nr:chitinase [Saccharothrix variisporea]RKT70548.1 glycosyl hydrolase family 18 (putative chitinase) [Saccharothrix variisporea]